MMGERKASEYKEAFQQAVARDSRAIQAWLDQEYAKLSPVQRRNRREVEHLDWVREALNEASKRKKIGRQQQSRDHRELRIIQAVFALHNALREILDETKVKHRKSKRANGKKNRRRKELALSATASRLTSN